MTEEPRVDIVEWSDVQGLEFAELEQDVTVGIEEMVATGIIEARRIEAEPKMAADSHAREVVEMGHGEEEVEKRVRPEDVVVVTDGDEEDEVSDIPVKTHVHDEGRHGEEFPFFCTEIPDANIAEAEVEAYMLNRKQRSQGRQPRNPTLIQELSTWDASVDKAMTLSVLRSEIEKEKLIEGSGQNTPAHPIATLESEQRERKRKGKELVTPTPKKARKPSTTVMIREPQANRARVVMDEDSKEEEEPRWERSSKKKKLVVPPHYGKKFIQLNRQLLEDMLQFNDPKMSEKCSNKATPGKKVKSGKVASVVPEKAWG